MVSCFLKNLTKSQDDLFDDVITQISSDLKSKYKSPKNTSPKLAVLQFMNQNGERSELGKIVSNKINSKMFDPSLFTLLERERIDSILEEHEFNQSGLVSETSMKQLGKLLGTELLLVGTLNIDRNSLHINSRIVNIETGAILSISEGKTKISSYIIENYNKIHKKKVSSITGAYNLTVNKIIVSDKRNWDATEGNQKPEIYFMIYQNERLIYPPNPYYPIYIQNSFEASFENNKIKIILENDDILKIAIMDHDILDDDLIGNILLPPNIILELINNPNQTLSFDNVKELKLIFNKIE